MFMGFSNESFVKSALVFSITSMVLMTAFISIFAPYNDQDLESSLSQLTEDYYKFTGAEPTSEEVWALSGIYTPYGVDENGEQSTAWGTTPDGWVYGARIQRYEPSQFTDLYDDKEAYTVVYDEDRGLYYYTAAGADLDYKVAEPDPDTGVIDPEEGTLYTSVAMDKEHKSDIFFTSGGRQSMENGTFYYQFSGWRYAFQPLRDYKASNDLNVDATTSSLSLIWYNYYGDDGISGQLMLSGSDSGVAYITGPQIVQAFNSASFSSKFEMVFNGIDMNVYIKINPYALQHYSVEECYENGWWSVLITSPSVADSDGFTLSAFSPEKAFDVIVSLLTFHGENYGLTGMSSSLASIFFTVSMYTSLIAIGLSVWPVLILAGIMAAFQGISAFL